jgi:hypothetical protein
MSVEQQLQNAAQAMQAAAEKGQAVVPVLKRLCRPIYQQILQDRRHPRLLSRWGRSFNVDENTGQVIVCPAIVQGIGKLAGIPMRGPVVHAGLQHTYGYLFSMIDTPHGAKRDRWLSTDLERGFGIDPSLLGERPRQGTLLANLTWFLAQIVCRDRPRSLRWLAPSASAPAPALVDYEYSRLSVCRIVEQVVLRKPKREVMIFTDLVEFPHAPFYREADRALLIYSVQNGNRSPLKLITAFPVRPEVVHELKAGVPRRAMGEVRLRYNAYLPSFFGRAVPGRRFFAGSAH